MKFKENNSGRPRGAKNKVTNEIKLKFEALLSDNLETLQSDLNKLTPRYRVHYLLELTKYVIPTLKATDIDLYTDNENFNITILNIDPLDNENN
jgi:predicted Zn-dependent protease